MNTMGTLTDQLEAISNELYGLTAIISALSGAYENPKDTPTNKATAEALCSIQNYLCRLYKDLDRAVETAAAITPDSECTLPAE